ncbi:polycystin 2 [Planoprotostelium fungivorum]|uniref:Polycystin 2 n=1 Tax=Planoprotostelium fungivorum TaxID=1890364 RepID=A0A2P6NBZ5_9EUKA|nr:polycystin 2 [Planoprotostelium fungivorum]
MKFKKSGDKRDRDATTGPVDLWMWDITSLSLKLCSLTRVGLLSSGGRGQQQHGADVYAWRSQPSSMLEGNQVQLDPERPTILNAECPMPDGSTITATLDLDQVFGNNRGSFVHGGKGFSERAEQIRLNPTGLILEANLFGGLCGYKQSSISLPHSIISIDGNLILLPEARKEKSAKVEENSDSEPDVASGVKGRAQLLRSESQLSDFSLKLDWPSSLVYKYNDEGEVHTSTVDLDTLLGNNDGQFDWGGSGFTRTSRYVRIDSQFIYADLYREKTNTWVAARAYLAAGTVMEGGKISPKSSFPPLPLSECQKLELKSWELSALCDTGDGKTFNRSTIDLSGIVTASNGTLKLSGLNMRDSGPSRLSKQPTLSKVARDEKKQLSLEGTLLCLTSEDGSRNTLDLNTILVNHHGMLTTHQHKPATPKPPSTTSSKTKAALTTLCGGRNAMISATCPVVEFKIKSKGPLLRVTSHGAWVRTSTGVQMYSWGGHHHHAVPTDSDVWDVSEDHLFVRTKFHVTIYKRSVNDSFSKEGDVKLASDGRFLLYDDKRKCLYADVNRQEIVVISLIAPLQIVTTLKMPKELKQPLVQYDIGFLNLYRDQLYVIWSPHQKGLVTSITTSPLYAYLFKDGKINENPEKNPVQVKWDSQPKKERRGDDCVSDKLFVCANRFGSVATQLESGRHVPYKLENTETQCTAISSNYLFVGTKTSIIVFLQRPRYKDMRFVHIQDFKCSPVKMVYDAIREQLVVLCEDKYLRCYDLRTIGSKTFADPATRVLGCVDEKAIVWYHETKELILRGFNTIARRQSGVDFTGVLHTYNDKIYGAFKGGVIKIWRELKYGVDIVDISASASHLVARGVDDTVACWSTQNWTQLWSIHVAELPKDECDSSMAVSNGQVWVASTLILCRYDLNTGSQTLRVKLNNPFRYITESPEGSSVVVALDNQIMMYPSKVGSVNDVPLCMTSPGYDKISYSPQCFWGAKKSGDMEMIPKSRGPSRKVGENSSRSPFTYVQVRFMGRAGSSWAMSEGGWLMSNGDIFPTFLGDNLPDWLGELISSSWIEHNEKTIRPNIGHVTRYLATFNMMVQAEHVIHLYGTEVFFRCDGNTQSAYSIALMSEQWDFLEMLANPRIVDQYELAFLRWKAYIEDTEFFEKMHSIGMTARANFVEIVSSTFLNRDNRLGVIRLFHTLYMRRDSTEEVEKGKTAPAIITNNPLKVVDRNGQTLLHHAAREGHVRGLEWLLSVECKVNTLDHRGRTALHVALELPATGDEDDSVVKREGGIIGSAKPLVVHVSADTRDRPSHPWLRYPDDRTDHEHYCDRLACAQALVTVDSMRLQTDLQVKDGEGRSAYDRLILSNSHWMRELNEEKDEVTKKEEIKEAKELFDKTDELHDLCMDRMNSFRLLFALRYFAAQGIPYFLWLAILMTVAFMSNGGNSPQQFWFHDGITSSLDNEQWQSISTVDDWYDWTSQTLLPYANSNDWYDSNHTNDHGRGVHLLGAVLLRQARVTDDYCTIPTDLNQQFKRCYAAHFDETRESYGPNQRFSWSDRGHSSVSPSGQLFPDGGYSEVISPDPEKWPEKLDGLKEDKWIDEQTRLLTATFTLWNVNLNTIATVTMSVEFTAAANPLRKTTIHLQRGERYASWTGKAVFVAEVFVIIYFLFAFVYTEASEMLSLGRSYLLQFWNYYEVSMIVIFSFICALQAFCDISHRFMHFDPSTDNYVEYGEIMDIQRFSSNLLAFFVLMAALRGLKYFKILPFTGPVTSSIIHTLSDRAFMIFLAFFLYVLIMFSAAHHLAFGGNIDGMKTFGDSIISSIRTILGEGQYEDMYNSGGIFGTLFFLLFVGFISIVLMNMFIAVLSGLYEDLSEDDKHRWELDITQLYSESLESGDWIDALEKLIEGSAFGQYYEKALRYIKDARERLEAGDGNSDTEMISMSMEELRERSIEQNKLRQEKSKHSQVTQDVQDPHKKDLENLRYMATKQRELLKKQEMEFQSRLNQVLSIMQEQNTAAQQNFITLKNMYDEESQKQKQRNAEMQRRLDALAAIKIEVHDAVPVSTQHKDNQNKSSSFVPLCHYKLEDIRSKNVKLPDQFPITNSISTQHTNKQHTNNNMPGREFERHSGSGLRGLPKKEGLKGWGKEGEEQPEEYLNKQDPNYSKRSDDQLSAADIERRSLEEFAKSRR